MTRRLLTRFILASSLALTSPALAQDSPQAVYEQWVRFARAGDIEGILSVSAAPVVEEISQELKKDSSKKEEFRQLLIKLAPKSYHIKQTRFSPDGRKAFLSAEVTAIDFFSLNDPQARAVTEPNEVILLQEQGKWKIGQQCSGESGCPREPDRKPAAWKKKIPLGEQAWVSFQTGKPQPFAEVALDGQAKVVDVVFEAPPDQSLTLSYVLHPSPNLGDFYLVVDDRRYAPKAFLTLDPRDSKPKPPTVLEENTSYSQSMGIPSKPPFTLSLLFDIPQSARGKPMLYVTFKVEEQPYDFKVR